MNMSTIWQERSRDLYLGNGDSPNLEMAMGLVESSSWLVKDELSSSSSSARPTSCSRPHDFFNFNIFVCTFFDFFLKFTYFLTSSLDEPSKLGLWDRAPSTRPI